ncbi:MAG: penicillin-binding protein 1A [Alphaproteobacteria bacterium]
MKYLWYAFLGLFSIGFLGLIVVIGAAVYGISYFSKDLPDYSQLKEYQPHIVTRLYAGDGKLLAEFAQEKRVFVPVEKTPDRVKHAFIAAEDQNFYTHEGVDLTAIVRAVVANFRNAGSGRRLVGASTITQQVAKNFLLTNEVSYKRKIREAILAYRMERAMSKDKLLELYLNEIFLGARSYGVAAASLQYFDKGLDELSIAEVAYLAALPKAPNNYHPVRKHDAAVERRNWVIGRMEDDGYITEEEAESARNTPLETVQRDKSRIAAAPYFAEEVRRELADRYGKDSLYQEGLAVRTSLDPALQETAIASLQKGLMEYDQRHGYRGALKNIGAGEGWQEKLAVLEHPDAMLDNWRLAVVLTVDAAVAKLGFEDGADGTLKLEDAKWARKYMDEGYAQGPEIVSISDVVKAGDVIIVAPVKDKNYALRQIPQIQGSVIAIDPHTGRVLAMQGGWKYDISEFNRATQALRQPGSSFKPFVYLTALDNGFTPSTLIQDAPFVIEDRPGHFWSPQNYSDDFLGPTPLRAGVEKSRNLMTVRLADTIGMGKVVETAKRFGIMDNMQPHLSYALGAGETTVLRMTTAYAMLVNGGRKITPTFIDRIQDRRGGTIFRHDNRACPNCGSLVRWENQGVPDVQDTREQVADPRTTYQMVSILEGVVQRGTATKLKTLGRPLAGKTGTTNKSNDTWFIGFSPDLVVGVFMGFDQPRSLGKRETGSSVALPVFKNFMEVALKDVPPMPFRVPPGVRMIQVNHNTGREVDYAGPDVIWEAFVNGTEPNMDDYIIDTGLVDPRSIQDSGAGRTFSAGDETAGPPAPSPLQKMPNDNVFGPPPVPSPQITVPEMHTDDNYIDNSYDTPPSENGATTGTGGLY